MLSFRFLPAAFILSVLAACSPDGSGRPVAANSPTASAAPDTVALRQAGQQFRVHYNSPVDLDSTGFYYLPVSVVPLEKAGRSKLFSSGSYDGYENGSGNIEGTCYNVLFFQKDTGQQRALLPHGRFVLTEIDAASKPDARWPYLFYSLIKADTNRDGTQDAADASALFVSDRSGQQLHQLTPDGTQLGSRYILPRTSLPRTSLLLVEVRPDTDRNGQFTHADGPYWLRFDLRNLRTPPVRQPDLALTEALNQQMLRRQSRLK
ncbi:hypothetical protein [Hymenobacter psychrophilus]|uniref:Lipoprotein n=1 Tax=Hymenobacter psychrophilus TaxID=651662 RepID=A0A1H3ATH9_9BACT|nr:hypothetical protein [Hymenobacter psychrophilus]SDX32708.1 hypothetical protein SAMN04488069_10130 [Hymenobacter psychrophilus]